ncbi:MAG: hypothetical protein WBM35_15530, partial [Candidatus Electrothrix sp.]
MLAKKQVPILWAVIISLCIALGLAALDRKQALLPEQQVVQQAVSDRRIFVARIGNNIISESALKEYLVSRSSEKDTLSFDLEKLHERLQEMVTIEILFQEAKRLGIDQAPGYTRTIKQILSQQLIQDQVVTPELNRIIPPDEIQKYYEEHSNEYARPAQIRLADIFIEVESGSPTEQRSVKRLLAEKVLAEALHLQDKQFGFTELINRYSDKHHAYEIGDTGFFA